MFREWLEGWHVSNGLECEVGVVMVVVHRGVVIEMPVWVGDGMCGEVCICVASLMRSLGPIALMAWAMSSLCSWIATGSWSYVPLWFEEMIVSSA